VGDGGIAQQPRDARQRLQMIGAGAFWCEQRLLWLIHWLIEEIPLGEIIFMSLRHRYFAALTDRRLILMGSTGMHKPIPGSVESIPRQSIRTTNFRKWLGGSISLDLQVNGALRRFKDDVSEVKSGFECGSGFDKFNDLKVGDMIEVFSMERVLMPA